jgi:predicted glycosyltransferase involved in capsule biosynthesis
MNEMMIILNYKELVMQAMYNSQQQNKKTQKKFNIQIENICKLNLQNIQINFREKKKILVCPMI